MLSVDWATSAEGNNLGRQCFEKEVLGRVVESKYTRSSSVLDMFTSAMCLGGG